MARAREWHVYCVTDGQYETEIRTVDQGAPTVCPVNAGHTIDSASIAARRTIPNHDSGAAPTASDDTDRGYEVGDSWTDGTSGKEYVCTDASAGAAVWADLLAEGGHKSIDVVINAHADPWWPTTSSTYITVADLIFRGTSSVGSPTAIKVTGWSDSGSTGAARIYDVTNSLVICENASYTETVKTIQDLGAISNLPAGEAVWEIQVKRATGTGGSSTYISACSVQF